MSEVEPLLTRIADASKLLGNMPLSTLQKKTSQKKIPHVKIGASVYYDPADLRAWAASQRIPVSAGAQD